MMATALVVTQTSAVAIIDMVEVMNVIHMVVMAVVSVKEIASMIEWDMEVITIAIMDMVEAEMEAEMEVEAGTMMDMEGVLSEETNISRQIAFNLNVLFSTRMQE